MSDCQDLWTATQKTVDARVKSDDVTDDKELTGWSAYCQCCQRDIYVRHRPGDDATVDGEPQELPCFRCGDLLEAEPEYQYYRVITVREVACLLCGAPISSVYLDRAIADDRVYLLACMVMHYRHEHVKYYNNSVGYVDQHLDVAYDDFKTMVNERAKRQIIRKARTKLQVIGVTAEHFKMLEHSDPKTLELAEKWLGQEPVKKKPETADVETNAVS